MCLIFEKVSLHLNDSVFFLAVRVQGKEREEEESEHRGFCRRGQSGASQETQGMCHQTYTSDITH